MKTIEELQADLKQLYADLEERRIMEQESVPQTVNFDELSSRAERYKIKNHPMSGKDEREQEMYLLVLLSVIALDDNAYEKSFSLLYRISHGMGFKGNVQEVFLKAQQMNFNNIDEITRMFINDNVRLVLLMECIMISQSFKKEKKKATDYIAELCMLMKIEKEQIILISNIARVILTQDVKEYKCDVKNIYDIFNCYICPLETDNKLKISLLYQNSSQYLNRTKTVYDLLNELPKEYECVFVRENISTNGIKNCNHILIAVVSNAPNLAYSLAMKKFNEAQTEI